MNQVKKELYKMDTVFVSHHNNSYHKSTKITNLNTMETLIYTDDNHDYEQVKEKIIELNNNNADYDEYYSLVCPSNKNEKKMEDLREELGIVINEDNTVTLPNGVILPSGISSIFNDVDDKEHFEYLMNFADLLEKNPYDYAKNSLIDWIMHNSSLTILPDGRIKGYRAVRSDFKSNHSGYGIVNGVEYENDHLDNTPGNIIEFPSFMIDHDPKNYCSIGLHVGTLDYATNFAFSCGDNSHIVTVAFSPSDVVSPPSDAEQSKIRVSLMEILEEINPGEK